MKRMEKVHTISKAEKLVNNMFERMYKGDDTGKDRVHREILSIGRDDRSFAIKALALTALKARDLFYDHFEIEKREMEKVKGFRKNPLYIKICETLPLLAAYDKWLQPFTR